MNVWKVSTIVLGTALLFQTANTVRNAEAAAPPGPQPIVGNWWDHHHGELEHAREALRSARHALEIAAEHGGGWRKAALAHTDAALGDVDEAERWGRAHD